MVIIKKIMTVNALPEFVALFKKTIFISCMLAPFGLLLCVDEKSKSQVLVRAILREAETSSRKANRFSNNRVGARRRRE